MKMVIKEGVLLETNGTDPNASRSNKSWIENQVRLRAQLYDTELAYIHRGMVN